MRKLLHINCYLLNSGFLSSRHSLRTLRMSHKVLYERERVYIRHTPDVDPTRKKVGITFIYEETQLNFYRVFHLNRFSTETLSELSQRIAKNVSNFIENKFKKMRVKKQDFTCDESVLFPTVAFTLSNRQLDTPDCSIAFDDYLTNIYNPERSQLRIGGSHYSISVNGPNLVSAKLPKLMMVGVPVLFTEFQLEFATDPLTEVQWQVSDNGHKWVDVAATVGDKFSFTPSANHCSNHVQAVVTPRDENSVGVTGVITSGSTVVQGVADWASVCRHRHRHTPQPLSHPRLRALSYNVLADQYADSDFTRSELHPYCAPRYLSLDYRRPLLVEEISGFQADIICLQEVDRKLFAGTLSVVFGRQGLDGQYTEKGDNGRVREGLAVFWRADKYSLVSQLRFALGGPTLVSQRGTDHDECSEAGPRVDGDIVALLAAPHSTQLRARLERLTQILQICVLRAKCSQPTSTDHTLLVVANTHLYFHPSCDHIRALQIGLCMRRVEATVRQLCERVTAGSRVGVLFCGDFNSGPGCVVTRLMEQGTLSAANCREFVAVAEEPVEGVQFSHALPMRSACEAAAYTNYVPQFSERIDHMFYDSRHLRALREIPMPAHEDVVRDVALPSAQFPSDHIPIVADFEWV